MNNSIDIIYSDEHLLIVNKPALLLSIPDRFEMDKPNLHRFLEEKTGTTWVVHRLDRETSGLICFARNEEAHKSLSQQFEGREVQKIYLALVDGQPDPPSGQIDQPIAHHPGQSSKMIVNSKGKPSLTLYNTVEKFRKFSLVEADIKTGRTHQVRVHMQHIGHPLAIDPLYGRRDHFMLSEVKGKSYHLGKDQEEHPLMSRLTLHALRLRIQHPATGETMEWEAPLPKDFRAVLQQLRKWG